MRTYVVRESATMEWDVVYAGTEAEQAVKIFAVDLERYVEVWVSGERIAKLGIYTEEEQHYVWLNFEKTTLEYTENVLQVFLETVEEGEGI